MNPASRVLNIYKRMLSAPDKSGIKVEQVLIDVLDIPKSDEDTISIYISLFRAQIDLAVNHLKNKGCPDNLFSDQFSRVKNIVSISTLRHEWASIKRGVRPDVDVAIAWSSWYLGNEEPVVNEEEIKHLLADLDELEKALQESSLSEGLVFFIKGHIHSIRLALGQSSIAGRAPLENAMQKMVGSLERNEAIKGEITAADKEGSTAWKKFKKTFKDISSFSSGANSTLELSVKVQEVAGEIGETVSSLMGQ